MPPKPSYTAAEKNSDQNLGKVTRRTVWITAHDLPDDAQLYHNTTLKLIFRDGSRPGIEFEPPVIQLGQTVVYLEKCLTWEQIRDHQMKKRGEARRAEDAERKLCAEVSKMVEAGVEKILDLREKELDIEERGLDEERRARQLIEDEDSSEASSGE